MVIQEELMIQIKVKFNLHYKVRFSDILKILADFHLYIKCIVRIFVKILLLFKLFYKL